MAGNRILVAVASQRYSDITPLAVAIREVETRVVEGSPRVMIQGVASEIGARTIVMGTHTKRGLDTVIGGTARAVIKSAPCRVVLVAPSVEESRRIREMIVPDDPVIFPYGWGHAAKH